jgi:hypothetical protein
MHEMDGEARTGQRTRGRRKQQLTMQTSKVIVQPLIEALSELVSQVSLIIVQNKAQNKAPPQACGPR